MLHCLGSIIIIKHIEQAVQDVFNLIHFWTLAYAKNIFSNELVNAKVFPDMIYIFFPKPVNIDPTNTVRRFERNAGRNFIINFFSE